MDQQTEIVIPHLHVMFNWSSFTIGREIHNCGVLKARRSDLDTDERHRVCAEVGDSNKNSVFAISSQREDIWRIFHE